MWGIVFSDEYVDDMNKYVDLFIDFDDTLYDTRGNSVIALGELFEQCQLSRYFSDPEVFYKAYWEANVSLWALYAKGEITRDFLIVERFRIPLSKGVGLQPTEAYCLDLSDKFLDLCSSKSGVIEGARELLAYLKGKGYRMHICSNGFHEVQYKKLRSSGLTDFFDTVILSEDAGANKPSKIFFDYALERTQANPSTTLMIGDNYSTDIEGAMNAGLDTLLFRRWDPSFIPPCPVTYVVDSLREIQSVL